MNIAIDMEWEPEKLRLMRSILFIPAGTATVESVFFQKYPSKPKAA